MRRASPSSSGSQARGWLTGALSQSAARTAAATSRAIAAAHQPVGRERRGERVEVGLARERRVQRLQPLGGLEQQRRSVAAARRGERDLRAQQLCPRAVELVQRAGLAPSPAAAAPRRALRPGACRARPPARAARGATGRASARRRARGRPRPPPGRRALRARAAERSSSAATSSSSPAVAFGAVPGAAVGVDDRRRWRRRAPGGRAGGPPARPRCRPPSARADGGSAPARRSRSGRRRPPGPRRRRRCPSPAAAFHSRSGSPTGSAAATSSSSRVAGGSAASRSLEALLDATGQRGLRRRARSRRPARPASGPAAAPAARAGCRASRPRCDRARARRAGPATTSLQQRLRIVVAEPGDDELRQPVEVAARRELRAPRGPARATPPPGAARRTRAPAPTPRRATARRRRRRSAAAPPPRRTAGSGRPARPGSDPGRRRRWRPNAVPRASACGPGSLPSRSRNGAQSCCSACERELHLRLDSRGAGDAAPRRVPDEVIEQRALADPGLATQHQRAARPRAHARHQLIQRGAFAVPPEQIACGHGDRPRLRDASGASQVPGAGQTGIHGRELQRFTAIGMPTLIIQGDGEQMTPTRLSHLMAGLIPDAQIHICPDAAHARRRVPRGA